MKAMLQSIAVIVTLTSVNLAGCGKSEPKPPPKAEDTVFGDYIKAKDRAVTETQKAMEQNQQKLEEAMKKNDEAAAP
jgi:predicted small lipoprotein YifL